MISSSSTPGILSVIFLLFVAQLVVLIEADPPKCEEKCEEFRPSGTDGPYRFTCQHVPKYQEEDCAFWKNFCTNCGPKKNVEESGNDRRSADFSNAIIIIIVVVVVLLICCCGGIAGCVYCCIRNNRRQQVNVPFQPIGQYGTSPSMMMSPGGYQNYQYPVSTTAVGSASGVASGPVTAPASNNPV